MGGKSKIPATSIAIGAVVAAAVVAAVLVVVLTDTTGKGGSGLCKVFEYDLEELRKIEPGLIEYEETSRIATGFEEARGLAVGPRDRILVAGDAAVRIFAEDGARLRDIAVSEEPRCLAVADDGTLYVGMKDHIEVFGPEGARKATWESAWPGSVFTSVDVSGSDVFVADAGNRVVLRCGKSGELVARIGEKDESRNVPGFVVPSPYFDAAVSPDGLLRVANPGRHRIEAYTFEGDLELWWGKPSMAIEWFSGCCNPAHFVILPDGRFVTSEKGRLRRIKIYDPAGRLESVVAGPEQLGEGTLGLDIAVDSKGRVLVLDPDARDVRIFTRKKSAGEER